MMDSCLYNTCLDIRQLIIIRIMNSSNLFKVNKFCRPTLATMALIYITAFIFIALARMNFPFELNWMEGGMLDVVNRALDGKPIFAEPNIDYVPFIYTPLYFYVSALVAKIIGSGFTALRLVSFISTIGSFLIIFLFVWRETRNKFIGLLSVGMFAAFYDFSDTWYDIGRNDSLCLFLLLLALFLIRFYQNYGSFIISGILYF